MHNLQEIFKVLTSFVSISSKERKGTCRLNKTLSVTCVYQGVRNFQKTWLALFS